MHLGWSSISSSSDSVDLAKRRIKLSTSSYCDGGGYYGSQPSVVQITVDGVHKRKLIKLCPLLSYIWTHHTPVSIRPFLKGTTLRMAANSSGSRRHKITGLMPKKCNQTNSPKCIASSSLLFQLTWESMLGLNRPSGSRSGRWPAIFPSLCHPGISFSPTRRKISHRIPDRVTSNADFQTFVLLTSAPVWGKCCLFCRRPIKPAHCVLKEVLLYSFTDGWSFPVYGPTKPISV